MSEHLARHVLERMVADHPRDPVPPAARVHVASCDQCAVRKRALETARAEYLAVHPVESFASRVSARAQQLEPVRQASAWRARLRSPAGVLAAACAIALAALVARTTLVAPTEAAVGFKGAPAKLETYVRRGSETRVLVTGEALQAGDRLAFTYTLSQPQHGLLLGIDDAGTVTRYFPEASLAAVAVLPAGVRTLPIGIELDARKRRERLVALFSAAPLEEQRVWQALSEALRVARSRGGGVEQLDELDLPASQVSVWFQRP